MTEEARLDAVDPVSGETIYAFSPQFPTEGHTWPEPADRWFAHSGGGWMAVAPWESEDDWFADAVEDGTADQLPNPRVMPIGLRPSSGPLVYRKADGDEAEEGGTTEKGRFEDLDALVDAVLAAQEGDSNDGELAAYRDALTEALHLLNYPRAGEV